MKKIVITAAFVFAAVTTRQAVACDYGVHADASDRTIVTCDGSGCHAIGSSTAQQEPVDSNAAATTVALH
jgi:hypothetical protein